ncbi:hypothetical protein D3C78_1501780 [compost metagenome]
MAQQSARHRHGQQRNDAGELEWQPLPHWVLHAQRADDCDVGRANLDYVAIKNHSGDFNWSRRFQLVPS